MTSTQTRNSSAASYSTSWIRGKHLSAEKRYHIEAELGEGSTSIVYRAVDTVVGNRTVALKVLRFAIASESETLLRLQHTAIVQVRDVGNIRDPRDRSAIRPYIAMDLEPGSPLAADKREHRKLSDSIDIIKSCGRALAYLHENGIAHFDIKPSNIFVARSPLGHLNGAKILDFGLAAPVRSEGISSNGGTYAYMSPEQISQQAITDQSDVFSFGVVAYELLTGRHPFAIANGAVDLSMLQRSITNDVAPFIRDLDPSVPQHVALVVHKALAKLPADRLSAREFVDLLDQLEVFEEDKRRIFQTDAVPSVLQIERHRSCGELDAAAEELRVLESRGWAFPELVTLRHQIVAARADAVIADRLAEASLALNAGDFRRARTVISLPEVAHQTSNVRLLALEAALDVHEGNLVEATTALAEAKRRVDAGAFREAEWFLSLVRAIESFDGLAITPLSVDLEAVEQALTAAEEAERAWLEACSGDAIPDLPYSTLAVQAITHARAAQRCQSTLGPLEDPIDGDRSQLLAQCGDQASEKDGALREGLEHRRQREAALKLLRGRLTTWNDSITVAEALQTVDDLLKVAPTRQLEAQRRQLIDLFNAALDDAVRERLISYVDDLCRIGEWETARACLDHLPWADAMPRLSAIEAALSTAPERERQIDAALIATRECRTDQAVDALRAALQADSNNRVLTIALAATLLQIARRQSAHQERARAAQTRSEAGALLDSGGDSLVLKRITAELRQVGTQPERDGISQTTSRRTPVSTPSRPPSASDVLTVSRFAALRRRISARAYSTCTTIRRHTIALVMSGLTVLLFAIGLYMSMGRRPHTLQAIAPQASTNTVLFYVAVTPATATLQIDGQPAPQGSALSPGSHSIVLAAPGYETLSETIEVTGPHFELSRALKPRPTQLQFTSNLPAAVPRIDAREFTDATDIVTDDSTHTFSAAFPAIGQISIGFAPRAAGQPKLESLEAQNATLLVITAFGDDITIFSPKKVRVSLNNDEKGEADARGLTIARPAGDSDAILSIGAGRERIQITVPRPTAPLLRVHATVASDLGSILVTADEDGSTVIVNGQAKGTIRRGRLLLQALKPGSYTVTITKPDFCAVPDRASLVLSSSGQVEAKFALEQPTIRLSEAPPGARILVNGHETSAPARIPGLVGTNTILATAPGYLDFEDQLQVSCSSEPGIALVRVMRPDGPQRGTLTLSLSPPHAATALYRRGPAAQEQLVAKTLRTTTDLDPGDYRLHLTADGHEAKDLAISVRAGQRITVSETLVPTPQTWSPRLAVLNGGAQRASALSVFGDADASGTYAFKLLRQGIPTRRFFGTWIVGYRSQRDYVEFRVQDGRLQWRRSGLSDFLTVGELSDDARQAADSQKSIYIRIRVAGKSVTHEIGGDEKTLAPVGSAVELQEGRFAIGKDSQIIDFSQLPT